MARKSKARVEGLWELEENEVKIGIVTTSELLERTRAIAQRMVLNDVGEPYTVETLERGYRRGRYFVRSCPNAGSIFAFRIS